MPPLPELLAWCHHGDGSWWLPRLRIGWSIEDEAERQAWDKVKQGDGGSGDAAFLRGMRGGKVDPGESCIFDDDGDAEDAA